MGFTSFSKTNDVEVILTGDVMLGRTVMTKSLDLYDPVYPFRKVASELTNADIVFINLENPIVDDCPRIYKGFKFCATPKMVEGLTASGVDVVTLANNHSGNFGQDGIEETVKTLESRGILITGLGKLSTMTVNEVEFGFLGFDFVSGEPKVTDFELVSSSNDKVDVLIVGVHWGNEYTEKASSIQREWAERLVEAGADVVVGHHPHWVQEKENINGKAVYYSLGNFVFDQMWSEKTREGTVVQLTYGNGELIGERVINTYMENWAQPEFVEAKE